MTFKAIFAAAAVSALMVGAAHAQSTSSTMSSQTPDAGTPAMAPQGSSTLTTSVNPTTTTTNEGVTTTTTTDTSAAAAGSFGQGASVTTSMTTNGPVPDTPENRAKYGAPMSNAGKHTAAKGN